MTLKLTSANIAYLIRVFKMQVKFDQSLTSTFGISLNITEPNCNPGTKDHYCIQAYTSHTKNVSKEQGVSFHLNPFPSLFQSSKQCSASPFPYWKLFGSPAFQFS